MSRHRTLENGLMKPSAIVFQDLQLVRVVNLASVSRGGARELQMLATQMLCHKRRTVQTSECSRINGGREVQFRFVALTRDGEVPRYRECLEPSMHAQST